MSLKLMSKRHDMKIRNHRHQPVPSIVRTALGLPDNTDHTVTIYASSPAVCVYVVHNARVTPYLVCAVLKHMTKKIDDDLLRTALISLDTVSVALSLRPDGSQDRLLRKSFRTGDFDYIARLDTPAVLSPGFVFAPKSKAPASRCLQLLTHRLENVLFEVHSTFRDIDGLHASDALDEICKLLYAKIFDEENSIRTGVYAFQRAIYSSTEDCSAEIRRLYYAAVANDRAIFANKIPNYDRSRGVFRDPLLLSSAAIVRAVEILQHYDLSNSPVDIKGRAFQNVLIPAVRSGMGQYFTPKEVIEFIVSLIRPSVRELILDPFCGSGHFLTAALDYVRSEHRRSDKIFHEFAFTRLHGIEKSDRMVRIAMTDMRLHGDGHSNIRCIDSLLPFTNYPDLYPETFDVIMTNPPFGIDLQPEALSQLGPFEICSERRSAVSLEIIAVERCLQLLRPGGRLAIVLPDGILSNRGTAYVRQWIEAHARVKGILSLPIETFTPFGANIKTSVLVVRKRDTGESVPKSYPVFLGDIHAVGYNSTGQPTDSNELPDVASKFRDFINAEGW